MNKNTNKDINVEEMYLSIPFYNWIDGDCEIANEMHEEGYPNANALERIKRFMILDFLTNHMSYTDDKFQKILRNYRKEENKNSENTESDSSANADDDFPF